MKGFCVEYRKVLERTSFRGAELDNFLKIISWSLKENIVGHLEIIKLTILLKMTFKVHYVGAQRPENDNFRGIFDPPKISLE